MTDIIEYAFHDGYQLGFAAGREVGRMGLDWELTEQDARRTEYIRGISQRPAYLELEARRWDGEREHFGRPRPGDFTGFGADYEPTTGQVSRDGR